MVRGLRTLVRSAKRCFSWRDLFIMRCGPREAIAVPLPVGAKLVAHRDYSDDVVHILQTVERDLPPERVQLRFHRGLHFYVLWRDGQPVATTWVVPLNRERFVDEIAVGFRSSAGDVWLRDIFVAPYARGCGNFGLLLDALRNQLGVRDGTLWSAVYANNEPSIGAHKRYGYTVAARFQVLHMMGRFIVRVRWPIHLPGISAFRPESRILLRTADFDACIDARYS
jgi:hypothetical protein